MQKSIGNVGNDPIFSECNPRMQMVVDTSMQTYAEYTKQQDEFRKAEFEERMARVSAEAEKKDLTSTKKNKDILRVPMGSKVVSTYKMVNGKRVLVGKKVVKN